MKNIITSIVLVISVFAFAQSPSQNYIKNKTYKVPSTGTVTSSDTLVNVTYFDGLGRQSQVINVQAGGNKQDIVTPFVYDNLGRQPKLYLPYADAAQTVTSLSYRNNTTVLSSIDSYYLQNFPDDIATGNSNPYSETFYDNSPLNRIVKQAAPGKDWKGNPNSDADHTIKFVYQTNKSLEVRKFEVNFPTANNTEITKLVSTGYHKANQLYKKVTRDENWTLQDGLNNTVEEFTDKQGKTLLKRAYNAGKAHDTYYVYDKFDNLTYVLPPLASNAVIKSNFTISPIKINYPWTKLSTTTQKILTDYDVAIAPLPNSEILNFDGLSLYGGRGGFSILPDENNNITLNINIITATAQPYRIGSIANLNNFGSYADQELGRIKGTGYEYVFSISGNNLFSYGYGNVPSTNISFTTGQKLEYRKNYPWTKLCLGDVNVMRKYENDIKNLDNSEILTTYTSNTYNARGGISISLDEFDTLTLSMNISSNVPMALATGNVFSLDLQRSIPNRSLGVIQGPGYRYEFSVNGNSLNIIGSGQITNAIHFSSQLYNFSYVIQEPVVDGLCYIYHYDKRNRVIEKRIPDNDWTHMVYDKLDRVILIQDVEQRLTNQWLYTKYDVFDRIAITGIYTDVRERKAIQDYLDGETLDRNVTKYTTPSSSLLGGVPVFYNEGNTFPSTATTPYTFQYYDNYFPMGLGVNYVPIPNTVYGITPGSAKGLPTVSYTKILSDSNGHWVTNVVAYDDKGRTIWNKNTNNFLGTEDSIETKLNFIGNVTETTRNHKKNTATVTVYDYYTYDNVNRPLKHTQKIGTGVTELIAQNIYDTMGQLIIKKVGGTAPIISLQTIDFTYNIRGWLKTINNPLSLNNGNPLPSFTDLFAFGIKYNNNGTYSLYNGNISQTNWRTLNDNTLRTYNYQYDDLNRLKNADFTITGATLKYNEGNITYDANGNILTLTRSGLKTGNTNGTIDNLSYVYKPNSNQLLKVSDASSDIAGFKNGTNTGNDYDYYTNGNIKKDLNKGIGKTIPEEITYNHLNLPLKVTFETDKYIEYIYSATGEKLQKTVKEPTITTTTQYANGFVYQNNVMQYFPNPEGYARRETNGNFTYVYQYKDHLGNVRLSYADTNKDGVVVASEIIEEDNYYPFGMKHEGYNIVSLSTNLGQKIKYNGKELQEDLQLGWYDYGARNYDPAISRWFNIDPLAEEYFSISPYVYVANNPIRYIDPNGMQIKDPDKIVENYKKQLNQSITDIKGFVTSGTVSAEVGNKLIGVNKRALNEVSTLEKSDQVYTVFNDKTSKEGGLRYDMSNDEIKIGIGTLDRGLIAHEIGHGYQYEKGEISLFKDNSQFGSLYDISDETQSYNRERSLNGGMEYFTNPTAFGPWNDSDAKAFGKTLIPPAYQSLPSGPIDINSKQGKALRQQTIEAGKNGQSVMEVYKGWQKDYEKGVKKRG